MKMGARPSLFITRGKQNGSTVGETQTQSLYRLSATILKISEKLFKNSQPGKHLIHHWYKKNF